MYDITKIKEKVESDFKEDKLSEIQINVLKEKYQKVYSVTTEIVEDDENTRECQFIFVRPKVASYDRYVKTASKSMTKSLQAFLFDNVVEEQQKKLEQEIEEYPALTLGIGQKLLALLGLSDNVNLMKL